MQTQSVGLQTHVAIFCFIF